MKQIKPQTGLVAASILLMTSLIVSPVWADDVFIAGFPDVPLLAKVTEQEGERIIFDTPSGTVAETILIAAVPTADVIRRYAAALPSFGWDCKGDKSPLRCNRDKNSLVFTATTKAPEKGRIILRLEPKK